MKSEIMRFDVGSGKESLLLSVDHHIEAPNWTPDGRALIVNGGGRLYQLPLASLRLQEIDTGFAKKVNNDHGISPDGRTLAISDATETGKSAIYTLPVEGGRPRLITPKTPSYWHGWSPDGATLAYTANRGEGYQIHTIPVTGGDETQLTEGFDHCDGPDYSPDGRWIWFNGEMDGLVDLWRMHPDGSALQRMTDDETANWFPHPSPNGRDVLFLAYPKGTKGHPFGLDVALRLMPSEGGESRLLTEFHGGQGTINVPCWSPDGREFAFVRFQ